MKFPYMKFYVGDYLANSKTKMLTWPEHGILLHFMFMAHDSEEYGLLRYSLKDIARALGCREKDLRSLQVKRVIKGADAGERCPAFVFVPRHAGKEGPPVTLLPEQDGPVWFSARMVVDGYVRHVKGTKGGLKETPEPTPKGGIGEPIGSHSISQSQKSESEEEKPKSNVAKDRDPASDRNFREEAETVLAYLNHITGRNYRPDGVNLKLIMARLKEGASKKDCGFVIERKFAEWASDAKMSTYLRPKTLFNATNFAQYVGELGCSDPVLTALRDQYGSSIIPEVGGDGYIEPGVGRRWGPDGSRRMGHL
jgi:uncharacterized phage protein (TIGR02220 family)